MRDTNAMRDDASHAACGMGNAVCDLTDATRASVARAAGYARRQMGRMSQRAGNLANDARPAIEGLASGAQRATVRAGDRITAHPLQVLAATIAIGYVVGRFFFPRRA